MRVITENAFQEEYQPCKKSWGRFIASRVDYFEGDRDSALKLRKKPIKEIADNRDTFFVYYAELVTLTYVEFTSIVLNGLSFTCVDLHITVLQKIMLLISLYF